MRKIGEKQLIIIGIVVVFLLFLFGLYLWHEIPQKMNGPEGPENTIQKIEDFLTGVIGGLSGK